MPTSWIRPYNGGTLLLLYIRPGASKSEVTGVHGERLKIRISAPPVDGEANNELVLFLSKILNLPKSKITVLRGETSRQKDLFIELNTEEVLKILKK